MGDCKYCGMPAGLLKNVHGDCETIHRSGTLQIINLIRTTAQDISTLSTLKAQIKNIAQKHLIKGPEIWPIIIDGWEKAVYVALEDNVLSEEEESSLVKISEHFSLTQEHLNKNGAYAKLIKGAVLREVMNGKIPDRIKVTSTFPFNLQKDEKIIWVFQEVKYYEYKTQRHFQGSSAGVSIRVAKGLYFRTGGFKGYPVEKTQIAHIDTGNLVATNKHLYFGGGIKSFRIPYKKIISFQPYSDGLGIQRDAANAKQQIFITEDGWFSYNLFTNLASSE